MIDQITSHKTTNNTSLHLDDKITEKKNLDYVKNHFFIFKYREKD